MAVAQKNGIPKKGCPGKWKNMDQNRLAPLLLAFLLSHTLPKKSQVQDLQYNHLLHNSNPLKETPTSMDDPWIRIPGSSSIPATRCVDSLAWQCRKAVVAKRPPAATRGLEPWKESRLGLESRSRGLGWGLEGGVLGWGRAPKLRVESVWCWLGAGGLSSQLLLFF